MVDTFITGKSGIYAPLDVSDGLHQRLQAMPKIELHVHLEGATDAETVWALAQRNHVDLPAHTLEEWKAFYDFSDFNHFIKVYSLAAGTMLQPEDWAVMAEQFLRRQAAQNVSYTEAFISASLVPGKIAPGELIAALREGAQAGEARYGSRVRFIPDIARQLPDSRFKVLDLALLGREAGVFIGLGLGGMEAEYPPELFRDVFAEARRQGLHVVAHAGEAAGPESVWGAIEALKAERIGHGVRSVEDPALVDYLAATQTPLEVSPGSNYRVKAVPADRPHPVRALFDRGVTLTLNSDDPTMFSTSLNEEYLLLAKQGFTWDELWRINTNAIEVSFLDEPAKARCRAEWGEFLETTGSMDPEA